MPAGMARFLGRLRERLRSNLGGILDVQGDVWKAIECDRCYDTCVRVTCRLFAPNPYAPCSTRHMAYGTVGKFLRRT